MVKRPGADHAQAFAQERLQPEEFRRHLAGCIRSDGTELSLLVERGAVTRRAVDLRRAHQYHDRGDLTACRGLEEVQGAHRIHAEGLRWIVPRVAHVGERREVVDDIGHGRLEVRREQGGIGHVDFRTWCSGGVPRVGQVAEKPGADEAGSSGQIGAHRPQVNGGRPALFGVPGLESRARARARARSSGPCGLAVDPEMTFSTSLPGVASRHLEPSR